MKKRCDYCKQLVECKNGKAFGAHKSNCRCNPKREEKIRKIKEANQRNYPKQVYELVCKKCGKEYTVELTENLYKKGKYRKHCSRPCATSHIQTPEQNEARRKKALKQKRVAKKYKVVCRKCEFCKTSFEIKENLKKKCCSRSCSSKYMMQEVKRKRNLTWSEIHLESFRKGRKPTGRFYVEWFTFKDIKVQGTYELRVCYILDIWKEIGKIKDWKYTWDRFDYKSIDGKEHSYFPDFKVFGELSAYYIEVKGQIREIDLLKWEAVRKSGYKLEIWRIDIIKKHENDYGIKICSRRQRKHIET